MGLFDGVSFRWDGKTVAIPADRLLGALARLEEYVTLGELSSMGGGARYGRIAQAFASVLRYAGVDADGEAVYAAMLAQPGAREAAGAAISALIENASPPRRKRSASTSGAPAPGGLVESLFKAIVGNGWTTADQFDRLAPRQAWWLIEAKTPAKMITPNMTEDEAEAIYAEAYGTEDEAA